MPATKCVRVLHAPFSGPGRVVSAVNLTSHMTWLEVMPLHAAVGLKGKPVSRSRHAQLLHAQPAKHQPR